MKAFNLAKFKKTSESKDWADLVHQDGHYLRIAKGPLSAIQRKQLENLAVQHQNAQHFDQGGVAQPEIQQQQAMPAEQLPQQMAPTSPQSSNIIASNLQTKIPAIQEEKAAQIGLANQIAREGRDESQAIQNTLDQVNKLPSQQEIVSKNKESSDKLFQAYKDQKLDPDHYWKDHSKLASGIGILISGIGQAVGGPNVKNGALEAIQDGINRDIDAQKNAQDQKHSLWKMNREALGDDLSATLATQNQLYTGLKYKIEKTAADSKGPLALAQANIANAKLDQLIGQNNFQLSLLSPTSDNMDPSAKVQYLVPENARKDVFKEISEAQNTVRNYKGIEEAFRQAEKDVRPISGGWDTSPAAFNPFEKTPGQEAFIARIGPTVQEAEGTVRKTAFDNIEHTMMPKFGDSDNAIATKYKSLQQYISSKAAATAAKGYGIDLSKYPSTNTLALGTKPPSSSTSQKSTDTVGKIVTIDKGTYQKQMINGKPYLVPIPTVAKQ